MKAHATASGLKELHALAWQTLTEPSPLVIFERMKQKLTPKTIEHLATQDRRKEVWDVVLPGFGVRVYPAGVSIYSSAVIRSPASREKVCR